MNELNKEDKSLLTQNTQVLDILNKSLSVALDKVQSCKNAIDLWNKLNMLYSYNCDECSSSNCGNDCSTSNSCEEEYISRSNVEKLVRGLYGKLLKANKLNETLKGKLEESLLEKAQICAEDDKLKLSNNELKRSNVELEKENSALKEKPKINIYLQNERETLRKE